MVAEPGTLYVVATPLGNLGDITLRARDTLRTVEVVAAEDTRRTRQLLHHLDAHPRLMSLHAHSPASRLEAVLAHLREGRSVALVSDAGTPVVSDPGARLVAEARAAALPVVPVPGVSAVTAALSVSGMEADRYVFVGFPPRKGVERDETLARAAREPTTVVFFEAANRLLRLLADLEARTGPDRRVMVGRELTKLHEELRAGPIAEVRLHFEAVEPRGEITVVLEGAVESSPADEGPDIAAEAQRLLQGGMRRSAVVRELVAAHGLPRNEVYRIVQELP